MRDYQLPYYRSIEIKPGVVGKVTIQFSSMAQGVKYMENSSNNKEDAKPNLNYVSQTIQFGKILSLAPDIQRSDRLGGNQINIQ
jgi:hypothetical protein